MSRTKEIIFTVDKQPLLIFGGPYSNLEALKALKDITISKGIRKEQVICTGDIVGYCADPDECVQFIKDWGINVIAGNVELNLRDEADDCGCNFNEGSSCDLYSKMWYPYAKSNLSIDSLEYISTLPEHIRFTIGNYKGMVIHGSYENTSEFIFKSTPWERKKRQFELTQSDIIICGHSGIPFYQKNENLYWVNAGVIGMPANDGQTSTWYATLSLNEGVPEVQFHQLEYDFNKASEKMRSKPLPQTYADTLLSGIWDNCEILPEVETEQQGLPLELRW